jgi:hypothetical protein
MGQETLEQIQLSRSIQGEEIQTNEGFAMVW